MLSIGAAGVRAALTLLRATERFYRSRSTTPSAYTTRPLTPDPLAHPRRRSAPELRYHDHPRPLQPLVQLPVRLLEQILCHQAGAAGPGGAGGGQDESLVLDAGKPDMITHATRENLAQAGIESVQGAGGGQQSTEAVMAFRDVRDLALVSAVVHHEPGPWAEFVQFNPLAGYNGRLCLHLSGADPK